MFKLTINLANAAFGDYAGAPEEDYELGRIIERVAREIHDGSREGVCWDSNGNKVGDWRRTKAL